MKLYHLGTAFLATIFLLTACIKITDPNGESAGTLQSIISGKCTPATVHGLFKVDSVLNDENYVDVLVDVTAGGSFTIKSDSVNGYSFKKTGTISAGTNTVRIYASGKPLVTGVDYFTVSYGSTICNFSITVFGAGGGFGTALYTLGGSPGNCSVSSITGNYVTGLAMTANNKVEMTVNVNTPGTYIIRGPTVNGVHFDTSGTFTNPGIQNIFLKASGTPLAAGTFNYPVTNGATNCDFSITYTTVITNATFSLSGSPGNCTSAVVNGTYTSGTALTASNTAVINVNVTSPGNYAIATTTVNGISFSATGTFNITGPQQVTLTGTGTPTASGTFIIPVTGNANTCGISVNVGGGTPPVNLDYVPETSFSNWSDKLLGGTPADTSYVQVSPNTKVINTLTYKIFEVKVTGNPVDSFYHRKNGGLYYQLYEGDYGILGTPISKDGLILDSSLAVNDTWIIQLGMNTVSGIPVNVKVNCQILAKNAVATVQGNNYTKIIKIKYSYVGDPGTGDIVFAEEERWYAKGFGLIYVKINDVPVTTTEITETTRIQIF